MRKMSMKAAQIMKYNKNIHIKVMDIPIPKMGDHDVLIRVKAAAVNPVDILNWEKRNLPTNCRC